MLALAISLSVGLAIEADGWSARGEQLAQEPTAAVLAAGDVRHLDRDGGKMTIDHGPLLNLGVPPAVRIFEIREHALFDLVKVGDSIRFLAENIAGQLTITKIETGAPDGHGAH